MPLHALVYSSNALPGTSLDRIDDLTRDAAYHNGIAGVTGVLLTDGRRFLQYIEGPEDGVASAYARILYARSHTEVELLGQSQGGVRRFPYWSLRWLFVELEDLLIVEASEWRELACRRDGSVFQVPTGIERLTELVRPHLP